MSFMWFSQVKILYFPKVSCTWYKKQWYQRASRARTTSHPVNNPVVLPNGDPQLGWLLVKHWLSLPYSPTALCSIWQSRWFTFSDFQTLFASNLINFQTYFLQESKNGFIPFNTVQKYSDMRHKKYIKTASKSQKLNFIFLIFNGDILFYKKLTTWLIMLKKCKHTAN